MERFVVSYAVLFLMSFASLAKAQDMPAADKHNAAAKR
jgi:hypothetical protein